jgi:hypothetical protein
MDELLTTLKFVHKISEDVIEFKVQNCVVRCGCCSVRDFCSGTEGLRNPIFYPHSVFVCFLTIYFNYFRK